MSENEIILTGGARRNDPHMPIAQVLQIWASRGRQQSRRVRIVELHNDGPGSDRYVEVVPATSPSGQGRRSRIRLDPRGRLSRYDFESDVATRLRCISPRTAQACAAFLRGKGLTEVYVLGDTVAVALAVTSVLQLADDALKKGWAHDSECARIIARLG